MNDCLFCKIISGDIPSEKVYEDEQTFAFLDIKPIHPGHTLVLPKHHARNIFDIAPEEWQTMMETARKLAPAIIAATGADGLNIHVNNEPAAGQVIFHSHIHLIPRFIHDGLELWHGKDVRTEELQKVRAHIVALL